MAGSSPPGGFGDGIRNSRSAPFSLHSRGVQLLDTTRLFDAPHQIKSASRHLRDLLSSLYVFALVQSWLSVYNLLITISATAFYSFYHVDNSTVAYKLDWTLVAFVIILPMLGFTWLVRHGPCASLPMLDNKLQCHRLSCSQQQQHQLPSTKYCAGMQAFRRREEALQDLVQGMTDSSGHPEHSLTSYTCSFSTQEAGILSCTCHDCCCFCSEVIVAAHISGASGLAADWISFLHAPGNCTAAAFLFSG